MRSGVAVSTRLLALEWWSYTPTLVTFRFVELQGLLLVVFWFKQSCVQHRQGFEWTDMGNSITLESIGIGSRDAVKR